MGITLAERLRQINAESAAWASAAPGRWAGKLTEDLAHWAGYGITTAEGLDKYLNACVEREREKGNLI